MQTLEDITEYVEETYNDRISVYNHGSHIRVTNGSAAMFGDISLTERELHIEGERYGERIQATCEPTQKGLENALSKLGL